MPGIVILYLGLALLALVLAFYGWTTLRQDKRLELRIMGASATGSGAADAPERFRLRPPVLLKPSRRDRQEIEHKLRLAGFNGENALQYFLWARLIATAVAFAVALLACRLLAGEFLAYPLLVGMAGGLVFILSKQGLGVFAARRERRLTAEFPFLLDLMLMMLESGVSLDQCFRSVARDHAVAVPLQSQLLARLLVDVDRGMSYDAALDRWAEMVGVSGARELASLFRQALYQGTELAPALRAFNREFTERRVTKAREAMGRMTVRMVIVMIAFFMPALFIVLAGPPVAGILDTLKGSDQ